MVKSLKLDILHLQLFNQNLLNPDSGPGIMLSIDETVAWTSTVSAFTELMSQGDSNHPPLP